MFMKLNRPHLKAEVSNIESKSAAIITAAGPHEVSLQTGNTVLSLQHLIKRSVFQIGHSGPIAELFLLVEANK